MFYHKLQESIVPITTLLLGGSLWLSQRNVNCFAVYEYNHSYTHLYVVSSKAESTKILIRNFERRSIHSKAPRIGSPPWTGRLYIDENRDDQKSYVPYAALTAKLPPRRFNQQRANHNRFHRSPVFIYRNFAYALLATALEISHPCYTLYSGFWRHDHVCGTFQRRSRRNKAFPQKSTTGN